MPATEQRFQLKTGAVTLTPNGMLIANVGLFRGNGIPVSEIVHVKATTLMGSYMCTIRFRWNGKEQRLAVTGMGEDRQFLSFVATLKRMLPPNAIVEDLVTVDMSDLAMQRVYPVGGKPMGFFGMSQPRWGVLLFWWLLAVCTLFLLSPFAIIATRRYRLYTNGTRLRLERFRTIEIPWAEVTGYHLVAIERRVNFQRVSGMHRYTIQSARARPTFLLTGIDGNKFRAELQARGVPAV
jgi:hypothetical protein